MNGNCTFDEYAFDNDTFDICWPQGVDAGGGGSRWDERFLRRQEPEEDDGHILALYVGWQMIGG